MNSLYGVDPIRDSGREQLVKVAKNECTVTKAQWLNGMRTALVKQPKRESGRIDSKKFQVLGL